MASFADDLADIARPRSMEYVAGMVEGNECGANAQRLARLIYRIEEYANLWARHPDASITIGPMADVLRSFIEEARR